MKPCQVYKVEANSHSAETKCHNQWIQLSIHSLNSTINQTINQSINQSIKSLTIHSFDLLEKTLT